MYFFQTMYRVDEHLGLSRYFLATLSVTGETPFDESAMTFFPFTHWGLMWEREMSF